MNEITAGILGICILMATFLTVLNWPMGWRLSDSSGLVSGQLERRLQHAGQRSVRDLHVLRIYRHSSFCAHGAGGIQFGYCQEALQFSGKFVGHIPGGLAMTTVVGATLFKAMCGSTLATCATFAGIAIPEMGRLGYSKKLSTGVVASVGTLGMLIPPSVPLMIYGLITEQSIGQLFLAGIVPGLLISLFFIFVIYGWVKIDPSIARSAPKSTWKERLKSSPEFLWVGIIFFVVIGGLMKGWFSPTEAGSIGTGAVLLLAYAKRAFPFGKLTKAFEESLRTACMVLFLIGGSVVFGHFLAVTGIPFIAADWISGLPYNKNIVMLLIILIYLIGGSIIDDLAFMILATPIFYPAVLKMGFDPIWFGIMIAITLMSA